MVVEALEETFALGCTFFGGVNFSNNSLTRVVRLRLVTSGLETTTVWRGVNVFWVKLNGFNLTH